MKYNFLFLLLLNVCLLSPMALFIDPRGNVPFESLQDALAAFDDQENISREWLQDSLDDSVAARASSLCAAALVGGAQRWTLESEGMQAFVENVGHNRTYNSRLGIRAAIFEDDEHGWHIELSNLINHYVFAKVFHSEGARPVSVALTPDAKYMACGMEDGYVIYYNGDVAGMKVSEREINAVDFNHTGRHLLSASEDGTLSIIDVDTGLTRKTFLMDGNPARSVRYHPSGRYFISGHKDGRIALWDVETMQPFFQSEGEQPVDQVGFYGDDAAVFVRYANGDACEVAAKQNLNDLLQHSRIIDHVAVEYALRRRLQAGGVSVEDKQMLGTVMASAHHALQDLLQDLVYSQAA